MVTLIFLLSLKGDQSERHSIFFFLPLREISFKQGTNKTVSKGYHYFIVMMMSQTKCHSKCSDFLYNQPTSLMCTPKRDDELPHNLYLRVPGFQQDLGNATT